MQNQTTLDSELQNILDGFVADQPNVYNGLLLVEGPNFKWKGAAGMAFPEEGLPMRPDDQFNIDSIAKIMTASLVMQLVETQKLALDDPIGRYLPDDLMDGLYIYEDRDYSSNVTIQHLMSHTSGLPDDWANPEFFGLIVADPQKHWTPIETIDFIKQHAQPAFPPGEGFQYSDPGYNLLGLIIEAVTGYSLQATYRTHLLEPLGMAHTYRPSEEDPRPSIDGRDPSQRYLDEMECTLLPAVMTADWAGGGLISTAEDLNRFLRAFVRDEIFSQPGTRTAMFDWVESGPYHNYGFGISRINYAASDNPNHQGLGEVWGHAGSSDNFMYYWPQADVTLIGTLNQINCEKSLYDNVAEIMRAVRAHTALAKG